MLRLHNTLCHIFVKMHLYDFKLCQLFAHPKVIVTQNYWFKINCTFNDTDSCHTLSPNPMEWPIYCAYITDLCGAPHTSLYRLSKKWIRGHPILQQHCVKVLIPQQTGCIVHFNTHLYTYPSINRIHSPLCSQISLSLPPSFYLVIS